MAVDLGTAKGSLTLDANSFFDSLNSALKSLDNFNDEIESSKKASDNLESALEGAGKSLDKDLTNKADKAADSVDDLEWSISGTSDTVIDLGLSAKNTGKSIDNFGKDLSGAGKELDEINDKVKESEGSLGDQKEAVDESKGIFEKFTETLKSAGAAVGTAIGKLSGMIPKIGNLNKKVKDSVPPLDEQKDKVKDNTSAFEKFIDKIEATSKKLTAVGEKISGFGSKLTKFVSLPISGVGTYALKSAIDVESATAKISTYFGEVGDAATTNGKLVEEVFAKNVTTDLDEVSNAIIMVRKNMSNLSDKEMADIASQAIVLEKTFGIDMNETLRGVNSLMVNFGLSAQEAMDYIVTGTQNGLDKTNELGDNLAEYGQIWSQAGFSAKEMFSILQNGLESGAYNLDKVNDFVKEFTISLSDGRIEENLSNFSDQTKSLFYSYKDGKGTVQDVFNSIINDLSTTMTKQEALTVASNTWSSLGEDNAMAIITSLNNISTAYDDVSGAAQNMQDISSSTSSTTITEIRNQIKTLSSSIGEQLLPTLKNVLEVVNDFAKWFSNLSPQAQKMIVIIGGIVAAIGPLITIIGKVISVVKLLKVAFTVVSGPIGLIVTAIAALVAGFIYLWNNCEGFRNFWISLWNTIKSAVLGVADWLSDALMSIVEFFTNISNTVSEYIDSAIEDITTFFTETIPEAFDGFIDTVSEWLTTLVETVAGFFEDVGTWVYDNILEPVLSVVVPVVEKIIEIIAKIWEIITTLFSVAASWVYDNVLSPVINAISNFVTSVVNFFKNLWNSIVSIFSTVFNWWLDNIATPVINGVTSFIESIKTFFQGLWNGIKDIFSSVASWFKDIFKAAYNAIKSVFNPIKKFFQGIWDGIKSIFSKAAETVANAFSDVFKAAINGVLATIESIVNFFVDGVNGVIDIINGIPGVSIGMLDRLSLPRLSVGLDYVPYDGYAAVLHKGERVMTKQENEEYSEGGNRNIPGGNTFNFYSPQPIDENTAAREFKKVQQELAEGF